MLLKKCTSCGSEKQVSEFNKAAFGKYGVAAKCIECVTAYKRKRYAEHKDHVKAINKAWRERNKEQVAAANAAWEKANPEKKRAYFAAWRDSNVERERARNAAWQQSNRNAARKASKEWKRANPDYNASYRAKRAGATPPWANPEYIRLWYEVARLESQRTGRKCHVDHIIPLNSPIVCGLHVETNLRVMFAEDNIRKGNRHAA